MGEHNITNTSLAFSMVLVLIAIVVSYREKLGLDKDIVWSICRAVRLLAHACFSRTVSTVWAG